MQFSKEDFEEGMRRRWRLLSVDGERLDDRGTIQLMDSLLPDTSNAWIILDLHKSHLGSETMDILKKKGYTPFFIPAYCTGSLQFHDVYVNRSFKRLRCTYWCNDRDWRPSRRSVIKSIEKATSNLPFDVISRGFRRLILPESVISDSKGPQAPGTLQPQTPKPFISTNIFTRYQARQMRKLEKHMAREEKRASRRERKAKKRERDDYAYVEDIIALLDDNSDADNANVEEK
eukprot:GILI01002181.1.p1 GENE.GILI01002181.1~~GILI01002181.1.p1  ORF type:complete len:232 (-),score=23.99 GILI01002181.1:230-925(-)